VKEGCELMKKLNRISLINKIFIIIVFFFFIVFFLFPIFWLLICSFKDPELIGTGRIFFNPKLFNYRTIFIDWKILKYFGNSLIVTVFSTLIALSTGTFAAYSLTRLNPPSKEFIAIEFLSLRAIPPVVTVIPLFLMENMFKMKGSLFVLVLIYAAMNLPLVIWMIAGFISEIPISIDDAALIDGCGRFELIRKITFPLIAPGVISTGIISFILAWNEFLFANILTTKTTKTLPIVAGMAIKHYSISWGPACAAGVVCILPVVILGIIIQKYLVRGLTFGAIK